MKDIKNDKMKRIDKVYKFKRKVSNLELAIYGIGTLMGIGGLYFIICMLFSFGG